MIDKEGQKSKPPIIIIQKIPKIYREISIFKEILKRIIKENWNYKLIWR